MVTPAVGSVVLVRFPFSDLSHAKLRPAVVLANAGRGDWVLCQITSNPYGDRLAIVIRDADFAVGSLRLVSHARRGKLFTGSGALMVREVGRLTPDCIERLIEAAVHVLRPGAEQTDG